MNKLYTDNSILQMEQDRLIRLRFISDEVIKKGQFQRSETLLIFLWTNYISHTTYRKSNQERLIRLRFISDNFFLKNVFFEKNQDSSAPKTYLFTYGQSIYSISKIGSKSVDSFQINQW